MSEKSQAEVVRKSKDWLRRIGVNPDIMLTRNDTPLRAQRAGSLAEWMWVHSVNPVPAYKLMVEATIKWRSLYSEPTSLSVAAATIQRLINRGDVHVSGETTVTVATETVIIAIKPGDADNIESIKALLIEEGFRIYVKRSTD